MPMERGLARSGWCTGVVSVGAEGVSTKKNLWTAKQEHVATRIDSATNVVERVSRQSVPRASSFCGFSRGRRLAGQHHDD